MPRTPEGIADAYVASRARIARGLNPWAESINVSVPWNGENLSFEEKRDAIVGILRKSRWYRNSDKEDFSGVYNCIEMLSDSEDEEEFDGWWDELYDLADIDRVWIGIW